VKQPLRKIPIGIPIGIFPIGIPVGIPLGKIPIGIFPTGIPIKINRKNSYKNRQFHFQLSTIFYLDKKDEIYHYSSKEHPKISKIAKFDCKML
jgi:hypothetical protein